MSKKRLLIFAGQTENNKVNISRHKPPKLSITGCSLVPFGQPKFLCDFGHFTV